MTDSNPPLFSKYKALLDIRPSIDYPTAVADECNLPLIDLSSLRTDKARACKRAIAVAASEWGFFQLVNHGISRELQDRIRAVQVDIFQHPFAWKTTERLLDFSNGSYRWGTPTATSLPQLSWSEAYHLPLTPSAVEAKDSTRHTIEEFAVAMSRLAHQLAQILAEELGYEGGYFKESCNCDTCYLRLNHYPPCAVSGQVFGLTQHTDSDFLTVLFQDQVGGLQLMKGGRWNSVKPNLDALIINIGDLFQAWSNGVYKSVEHRVVANPKLERFSVAYFLCPSYDTMVQSYANPSIYKTFTFGEYRQKVMEDVKLIGTKVGLPRFLA
uniref:GA2ox3 n=1 Tax=Paris polyphylla var. yunnanensis TaxID=221260 RepID=A0A2P1NRD8_PARPY|nr:GA2ox3 [Paris polyphylla var. yunnanensis]